VKISIKRYPLNPDYLIITCKDTGVGIPKYQQRTLFEKINFDAQTHVGSSKSSRSAHHSHRGGKSGAGLGLYITKGLVELHGGSISVHSDGSGTGSVFTVKLPFDTRFDRPLSALLCGKLGLSRLYHVIFDPLIEGYHWAENRAYSMCHQHSQKPAPVRLMSSEIRESFHSSTHSDGAANYLDANQAACESNPHQHVARVNSRSLALVNSSNRSESTHSGSGNHGSNDLETGMHPRSVVATRESGHIAVDNHPVVNDIRDDHSGTSDELDHVPPRLHKIKYVPSFTRSVSRIAADTSEPPPQNQTGVDGLSQQHDGWHLPPITHSQEAATTAGHGKLYTIPSLSCSTADSVDKSKFGLRPVDEETSISLHGGSIHESLRGKATLDGISINRAEDGVLARPKLPVQLEINTGVESLADRSVDIEAGTGVNGKNMASPSLKDSLLNVFTAFSRNLSDGSHKSMHSPSNKLSKNDSVNLERQNSGNGGEASSREIFERLVRATSGDTAVPSDKSSCNARGVPPAYVVTSAAVVSGGGGSATNSLTKAAIMKQSSIGHIVSRSNSIASSDVSRTSSNAFSRTTSNKLTASQRVNTAVPEWLSGFTVLLVDDSLSNLKMVGMLMKRLGCKCVTAANGADALEMVKSKGGIDAFDFVLMDNYMPVMDGSTACKKLRELGFTRPIIGLTGHVLGEDMTTFKEAGANAVLTKPLDVSELKSILALLMNTTSAHTTE
jgi:CheY-like chemotaxis protein